MRANEKTKDNKEMQQWWRLNKIFLITYSDQSTDVNDDSRNQTPVLGGLSEQTSVHSFDTNFNAIFGRADENREFQVSKWVSEWEEEEKKGKQEEEGKE